MKEQITPSELLEVIRKSVLADAPIADILQTPLPELMEQVIGSTNYADALPWLYSKFWEDEERQSPRQGTPLVDDNGQLWSREEFGDDLTDEEYQLTVRLYALAEWACQLYCRQPFDLRRVMADYQPRGGEADFDYPNTALCTWALQTPLRRLAALTTRIIVLRELEKAAQWDQPIQDYYAEHSITPQWSDIADCEKYTKTAWEAMQTVADHCAKARQLGLSLEQQSVADALWSWVPHDFDDDVVAAAREICQQAEALMPDPLTIRSDQGSRAYTNKVWTEVKRIAQEHDVYLDTDAGYSLSMGYLTHWLDVKYWDGRRPVDD